MFIGRLNKVFVFLIAGMFLSLSPVLSYGFDGLGLNQKTAEKVSDSAMDDMRGKYYGFYFSINFTGYWDTLGSIPTAKITYKAGLGKKSNAAGSINLIGTQDGTSSSNSTPSASSTSSSSGSSTSSNTTSSNTSSSNSTPSASSASSSSGSSASSDEPAVQTTAVIGGSSLNGSGGVMQLTQVPGSRNFVYSGIVINLSIFNIKDTADSSLRNVLSSMMGL